MAKQRAMKAQQRKLKTAREAKRKKHQEEHAAAYEHREMMNEEGFCDWDGTILHVDLSDDEELDFDPDFKPSDLDSDDEPEEGTSDTDSDVEDTLEFAELLPQEFLDIMQGEAAIELRRPGKEKGIHEAHMMGSPVELREEKLRKPERKRKSASAHFMRSFIRTVPEPSERPAPTPSQLDSILPTQSDNLSAHLASDNTTDIHIPFVPYASDIESDDDALHELSVNSDTDDEDNYHPTATTTLPRKLPCSQMEPIREEGFLVLPPPPSKRRKLDVPARKAAALQKQKRKEKLSQALHDITKLIESKKTKWEGNKRHQKRPLQALRAQAIESHLIQVVKRGKRHTSASEMAAEYHGWSKSWGGRMVRKWVRCWVETRKLPDSSHGFHAKTWSFLQDPVIREHIRTYLRSNKWAMDPGKLHRFLNEKLLPDKAKQYTQTIVENEMPAGLKKYIELELFPRIHFSMKKKLSLTTARDIMSREGFTYTEHKKALWYDGHKAPPNVKDRQERYLPQMEMHSQRLICYEADNTNKEVEPGTDILKYPNGLFVQPRLVCCAHDEMTAQAHDGHAKSWVLDGEQPLKKKGPGRGMHQSEVICSTVGHLKDAGQALKYGKNYDGYWNGEMFIKQLREKIIPAFEAAHGAGHQALFLIDNSQGHSAYGEDALLARRMNFNPGGKQARMRDGWFFRNGTRVIQPMTFPCNHSEFPDQPKGMKQVLQERGIWRSKLLMKCKKNKETGVSCTSDHCCARRILENQPDFLEQKSLVQEVIEASGHLCIFLPKYHCELNYIEFFWGAVKKYLRDHTDYTFDTLKENLPKAMANVKLETIRKWELRTIWWCKAYRAGLGAKEAQDFVKKYSLTQYKSHRRVPEAVARQFDA